MNSAFDLYFVPNTLPTFAPQNRDHKGNNSDGGDRRNQGYLQKCEGNTNSQGINAGGNGKNQHFFEIDGGAAGLGLVVEGLFDHVAADENQENEGDPVVVGNDGLLEAGAKEIADGGHQGLEGTEIEGDDDGVFLIEVFQG